uniref:Uncharacterized protein n=1 Tax=Sinocyclocheilus rhinocerous TaxID=307959 RepID=A0A673L3C3_9TELE
MAEADEVCVWIRPQSVRMPEFDVIVLGTRLKRVLHMDSSPYYGGESASFPLCRRYIYRYIHENTHWYPYHYGLTP